MDDITIFEISTDARRAVMCERMRRKNEKKINKYYNIRE